MTRRWIATALAIPPVTRRWIATALTVPLVLGAAACGGGRAPGRATPAPGGQPSPAGAHATWILTRNAVRLLIRQPQVSARLAGGTVYEIVRPGQAAALPVPGATVVPTVSFPSYVQLAQVLGSGDLPAGTKAVIYDAEAWHFTPDAERAHPLRYYELAGAAAHRRGLTFIAAPALDLAKQAAGPPGGLPAGYLDLHLPQVAAFADVFVIQSQSLERDPGRFERFVAAAAAAARSANASARVLAGISSNPPGPVVTAATMAAAVRAAAPHIDGFWLNLPGRGPQCPACNPMQPEIAAVAIRTWP